MAANGDGGAHIERLRRLAEATHRAAAAWDLEFGAGDPSTGQRWMRSSRPRRARRCPRRAKSYLHSRVYEMSFGDGEIDLSENHFSERSFG